MTTINTVTVDAIYSDGLNDWRIDRLNQLLGAFTLRIGCTNDEVVERTGLRRLYDHKGLLSSTWETNVDETMWSSVITDLWLMQFNEDGHEASAISKSTDERVAYYIDHLKKAVK